MTGRTEPLDLQRLIIVIMMCLELGHAVTALTPDGHNQLAAQDRFTDQAMGPLFHPVLLAISALRFAVAS